MAYLHGVKSNNVPTLGQGIRLVPEGVIAFVGISPDGPTQALTLCNNETDDAVFGSATPANDIALTLKIIRQLVGNWPVIVVNVFSSSSHTANLSSVSGTVTNGKITLAKHLYGTITVTNASGGATISPSNYTIDAYGNFKDITTAGSLEGLTLNFAGKYVTTAAAADIVGTVSSGVRTGMKLWEECMAKYGYNPKILLTPKYSILSAVYAEGRAKADYLKAIWLHDSNPSDTASAALTNRGSGSTIGWNTTDDSSVLLYPQWYTDNAYTASGEVLFPYSAFFAGAWAASIRDNGFWYSPSNKEMGNVKRPETLITTSWTDSNAENQQLNAQGITNYLSAYGTGYKTWGNRNASYPTSTSPLNFIVGKHIDNVLTESIEQACVEHNDKPINKALIDTIRHAVNTTIDNLITQGALVQGSELKYFAADNPPANLANGQVTFDLTWMFNTPAELIVINKKLDITLLNNINKAVGN